MIDRCSFGPDGLMPAVVQDALTGRVLMVGYMNAEAVSLTLADNLVTFWSRSRGRLWRKGETSGNLLHLVGMYPDCDGDTLLLLVRPEGPTCHTGAESCFDGVDGFPHPGILEQLESTVAGRRRDLPTSSYTAGLFRAGTARIAQKVGEEGVEVALAAVQDDRHRIREEAADLLFHLLVLLVDRGIPFRDVLDVLDRRRGDR